MEFSTDTASLILSFEFDSIGFKIKLADPLVFKIKLAEPLVF